MAATQIRGANNGTGTSQIKAGTISNADIHNSAAIALSKLAEAVIQADGDQAFTADQSMGGFKLTSVATPVSGTDAANKAYVDSVAAGLDPKASVRFATTAVLPTYTGTGTGILTLTGQTAWSPDGSAVVNGDRVLVKNEGSGTHLDNGIYTVSGVGSEVVLTRSTDADTSSEVTAGLFTFVEEGTTNADSGWVLSTNNPITLNTTALAFTQFSGAGSITAGTGLTKTGNTINFNTADTSLTVNSDDVAVNLNTTGGLETSTGVRIKKDTTTANTIGITTTANGAGILFDSASFVDSGSETLALASGVAGAGLTLTAGILAVGAGDGITVNANDVALASTTAGAGLTFTTGVLAVGAGTGITVAPDTVSVDGTVVTDSRYVARETPNETPNGSITAFTIDFAHQTGTEHVYLNGLLQEPGGEDYTVTNSTTFTFVTAPVTGDRIRISYIKD